MGVADRVLWIAVAEIVLDEPKIIDSEAGIPQESARCAFRNLRVIGNDQPSIGWLIVAKDDVATSLPIDSIAKPTKDFYQLPTG